MDCLLSPNCFFSLSLFALSILSIYGIVGLILNIFQSVNAFNFGEWPFNIHPILYAFVAIQGLFPAAGFFAILAVLKKQPLFIYGSGSVLLGIFTCSCVFGAVSYRPTLSEIMDEFYTGFRKNINRTEVLEWMNDKQWKHKCCGVYSYADWSMEWDESGLKGKSVPSSCCRRENKVPNENCGSGILSAYNAAEAKEIIYTSGCGPQLSHNIGETLRRTGIEIWIVGGISLLVAIFLYVGTTKIYIATGTSLSGEDAGGFTRGRSSSSPATGAGQGDRSLNGTVVDAANNNQSISKSRLDARDRHGVLGNRKRQRMKLNKYDFGSPMGSFHAQRMLRKSHNVPLRKDASGSSGSASILLTEQQSRAMANGGGAAVQDQHLFRKNVDMLWYQSMDKNMSALTPTNDYAGMSFPPNMPIRKPIFSPELINAINEERNTVYTLVSERPFTPSLSQNCSMSFFNSYPFKVTSGNGNSNVAEPITPGQCSPNFSSSKQQRHYVMRHEEEPPEQVVTECHTVEETSDQIPNPANPTPSQLSDSSSELIEALNDNIENPLLPDEEICDNEPLILQTQTPPPSPAQNSTKYPTSSVRSSTLATIQEESESSKGTPSNNKGGSPSICHLSPETVSPKPTEATLTPPALEDGKGNLNMHDLHSLIAERLSENGNKPFNEKFDESDIPEATADVNNTNLQRLVNIEKGQESLNDHPLNENVVKQTSLLRLDSNMNSGETLPVASEE